MTIVLVDETVFPNIIYTREYCYPVLENSEYVDKYCRRKQLELEVATYL